jgi:hypothetical protein
VGQVHGTRRNGTRRDATERIRLRREAFETSGWTLNISRGGARLVLEEAVELGQSYQVEMGVEAEPRQVRIIWAQDEADGQIVGVQFLDVDGSLPPPPKAKSSAPPRTGSSLPPRTNPMRPKLESTEGEPTDAAERVSLQPPPPKPRS